MSAMPSRAVKVGDLTLGGGAPVAVQSMTNTRPEDPDATLAQVNALADAGAALVRCAVPTIARVGDFAWVAERSPVPVVADVHYDWRIAIAALKAGAAKVRVNPGNMRPDTGQLEELARVAAGLGRAVRVGVNSGSARTTTGNAESAPSARPTPSGGSAPESLVEQAAGLGRALAAEALGYVERFEHAGLTDVVVSIKAPDAAATVAANRELARQCDRPIHLGVTHAGLEAEALLKNAVALGGLLLDGIGDTLRLSYTGDPVREVIGGYDLLRATGRLRDRPELVSCPTCGRCRVNLTRMAEAVRARFGEIPGSPVVAVMGCEVNGPGEAKAADVGLAASGGGRVVLFAKGRPPVTVPEAEAVEELIKLARTIFVDNFGGMR